MFREGGMSLGLEQGFAGFAFCPWWWWCKVGVESIKLRRTHCQSVLGLLASNKSRVLTLLGGHHLTNIGAAAS